MPSDYTIDRGARLVRVTGFGALSDSDLLEQRVRIRDDPSFDASFSFLVDLRAVTDVLLSAQVVARHARGHHATPGRRRARRVAVGARHPISTPGVRGRIGVRGAPPGATVPHPLAFGLGRVFQSIAALRGEDVEVFTDLALATRWLADGTR